MITKINRKLTLLLICLASMLVSSSVFGAESMLRIHNDTNYDIWVKDVEGKKGPIREVVNSNLFQPIPPHTWRVANWDILVGEGNQTEIHYYISRTNDEKEAKHLVGRLLPKKEKQTYLWTPFGVNEKLLITTSKRPPGNADYLPGGYDVSISPSTP